MSSSLVSRILGRLSAAAGRATCAGGPRRPATPPSWSPSIVPTIGIACAAVAVDTGTWYVEMQMAQKAADAAALAGVPYLPAGLPERQDPSPRGRRPQRLRQRRATTPSRCRSVTRPPSSRSRSRARSRTPSARRSASRRRPSPAAASPTTRARPPWAVPATPSATSRTPAPAAARRPRAGRRRARVLRRTARGRRSSGPRSRVRRPTRCRATATRRRTASGSGVDGCDQRQEQQRVRRLRLRLRRQGGRRRP